MIFKVGDKVRAKKWNPEKVYTILDAKYTDMVKEQVYLINKYFKDGESHENWFTASELAIVDLIKEPKFKIGDRVKIIKCNYFPHVGMSGEIVAIRKDVRINESLIYELIYDIKLPDGTVYGTINEDGDELELIEVEKPKIEAVVKCIATRGDSNLITKDKYYPVIKIDEDGDIWIKDDNGDTCWFSERCFELFKVGDKFERFDKAGIAIIKEFKIIDEDIWVTYCRDPNIPFSNLLCIKNFDILYHKFELSKKEPELLPVGTRIVIIKSYYFELMWKIGTIVPSEKGEKSGEYFIKLDNEEKMFTNPLWIPCDQIEKLEEPKPKWQPKFKVGDWVTAYWDKNRPLKVVRFDKYNRSIQYRLKYADDTNAFSEYEEEKLELFQPMQELKDEIEELKDQIKKSKLTLVKEIFDKYHYWEKEAVLRDIEREFK